MNTNKSFIGAYARNRRGSTAAQPTPASSEIPAPHLAPSAQPELSPPELSLSKQTATEVMPREAHLASMETIESVESLIRRSLSVSDVVAEPAPEVSQVWIDQPQGQLLRVDIPTLPEPTTQSVESTIPAPIQNRAIVQDQAAVECVTPVENPAADPSATINEVVDDTPAPSALPPATPHRWAGAAWEVDAFEIPHSVSELFFDEDFFRSIAEHMGQSIQEGLRSVLVTSVTAGEGRSTVAIGTAIAAAASGARIALVDVDVDSPGQADHLRLEIEMDWVDAVRNGEPLENAAIASIEDGVTLLPLSDEQTAPVTPADFEQLIDRLQGCFDLVMFDGSMIRSWSAQQIAAAVDSSLIVRDVRSTSKSDIAIAANALRKKGVRGIGVVDNFCG